MVYIFKQVTITKPSHEINSLLRHSNFIFYSFNIFLCSLIFQYLNATVLDTENIMVSKAVSKFVDNWSSRENNGN